MLKTFKFQFKIKVIDRSFGNLLPLRSQNVGLGLVETSSNTTSSIALKLSITVVWLNLRQKLKLVWSCLRETKWQRNKAEKNMENYGTIK